MEASCSQFIEKLMKTSNFLEKIGQKTLEYWEPDIPPVTIFFAAIGKELACRFDSIGTESKMTVFDLIEEGMNSTDNDLRIAVATGIIEALVSVASTNRELRKKIESQLGTMSKRHADAWSSFH
jgi:hypothetical protein